MSSKVNNLPDMVRSNYFVLQDVPLEDTFRPAHVGISGFTVEHWERANVIEPTGDEDGIYQLTPDAREFIRNYDPDVSTPCGHRGVRNLGGGRYTCCFDECDVTWDREVAGEILGVSP